MSRSDKRKRTKRRFGALFWVSVLLIGSASVRLGIEAAPAIAGVAEEVQEDIAELPRDQMAPEMPAALEQLLHALQKREAAVEQREREIEDRMKALEIADQAIEEKTAAMVRAEEALSATLAIADGASEADLTRLTSVYERMKPKDAANLFETMDPAFAAGFLGRMKPEVAAGILSKLTPEAAYTISVILAGRNATVPKE